MVRAKFRCDGKNLTAGQVRDAEGKYVPGLIAEVVLRPVVDADAKSENGQFYAATPSGEVKLTTVNGKAAEVFVPGRAYYLDFTPAD